MFAFIALLHVVGWGTLLAIVAPQNLSVGSTVFGVGLGLTAYMLGVRHAFDADHIAAIDNTTRKLMQEGRRPASVGFWFSFGHSSVVFALTLVLLFGIGAVARPLLDGNSQLHAIASLVGTAVSSCFLYIIAALNLVVLFDIWKVRTGAPRRGRAGGAARQARADEPPARPRHAGRHRALADVRRGPAVRSRLRHRDRDRRPGADGSSAASGVPWYAVLCLPILFAAGMSLFDTLDGTFMTIAYGWARERPERKLYYNLVVTSLSVAVALFVGTLEIAGLIVQRLDLRGPVFDWLSGLDLNRIGIVIVDCSSPPGRSRSRSGNGAGAG